MLRETTVGSLHRRGFKDCPSCGSLLQQRTIDCPFCRKAVDKLFLPGFGQRTDERLPEVGAA
jgi:hypothetical protein